MLLHWRSCSGRDAELARNGESVFVQQPSGAEEAVFPLMSPNYANGHRKFPFRDEVEAGQIWQQGQNARSQGRTEDVTSACPQTEVSDVESADLGRSCEQLVDPRKHSTPLGAVDDGKQALLSQRTGPERCAVDLSVSLANREMVDDRVDDLLWYTHCGN